MDQFTTYWDETPVLVTVAPQTIRPVKQRPVAAAEAPGEDPGVLQIFVNTERNSRLAVRINLLTPGPARFEARWSVELPEAIQPVALLHAGDRIVVNGVTHWRLYDMGGKFLQSAPLGASRVVLHPPWTVFFAADVFGLVNALHLENGQPAFTVSLHFGKEFSRGFMAAMGNRLITLSTEMLVDLHGPDPERFTIEATDLGKPEEMKSWNHPGGPVVAADLIRESNVARAAIHGDTIVLATVDRVYLLGLDLKIKQVLDGTFLPTEISLDEEGRIYLMVYTEGHSALWLLTPDGERLYSFDLPVSLRNPSIPPIVAYDHTAYTVSAQHILSIATDGKLNWMRPGLGPIGGASVTADNQLLVSEGDTLSAWDAHGKRLVLYTFPGEQLATAPILLANGDLLVASAARLICLRRLPPHDRRN